MQGGVYMYTLYTPPNRVIPTAGPPPTFAAPQHWPDVGMPRARARRVPERPE